MSTTFHLVHSCCDGAGSSGHFDELADAIGAARASAQRAADSGDAWGYRWTVYGPRERRLFTITARELLP